MHAASFVVVDNMGPIGVGWFDFVEWHKKEQDDLLTELGVTPVYGDIPDYGHKQRGWLSDYDHRDIITRRKEGDSMHTIARDACMQEGRLGATWHYWAHS